MRRFSTYLRYQAPLLPAALDSYIYNWAWDLLLLLQLFFLYSEFAGLTMAFLRLTRLLMHLYSDLEENDSSVCPRSGLFPAKVDEVVVL